MVEAASEGGLRVLGVTGGVGSGKSTAAKLLADALGARLLDADQIVQNLLKSSEVLSSIEVAVGFSVRTKDGSLDRSLLAERVFGAEEARKAVEGILHPAVRDQLWAGLDEAERSASPNSPTWAVLDVPLLREGGLDAVCDFIVHIEVPASLRCARACARHGWSADTWEAREAAQMPVDEKRSLADAILVNDAERSCSPSVSQLCCLSSAICRPGPCSPVGLHRMPNRRGNTCPNAAQLFARRPDPRPRWPNK